MANRRISWILCLVAVFGLASIANAQSLTHSSRLVSVPSHASAPQGGCGPTVLTESSSNTVTPLNSVSCNNGVGHTDNSYFRAFLLSDFGIVGNFDICNVQIGVEEAASGSGTGQPITVNLYTSDQPFPTGYPGSLTLIGTSGSVNVLDQSLTLLDIPVTGTAPAGSQFVVEIFTPDGTVAGNLFFIGSNTAAETQPSYILAAACGITVPTPTDGIIPGLIMHIVMNVTGTEVVPLAVSPVALAVDPVPPATPAGNGVLEMNTDGSPLVVPTWSNDGIADITLTGVASNLTGPAGPTYTIGDPTANYGTVTALTAKDCLTGTPDCYEITISGTRPQQHFDATMDETVTPLPVPLGNGAGVLKTWTLHVGNSFSDVSIDTATNPFYPFIETIFHNGVTAGCGDGSTYCPLQNNLRQEMAVFLLKASQGAGYVPPACTPPGLFSDVPCPSLYADWIEDIFLRGITAGCSSDPGPPPTIQYCPDRDILRQEMAVFLLKASQLPGYVPPACTPPGLFSDVPCPSLYADWIEDIFLRGITAGCSSDPGPPPTIQFCPNNPVTRQEMAAFLRLTFSLVLYGP